MTISLDELIAHNIHIWGERTKLVRDTCKTSLQKANLTDFAQYETCFNVSLVERSALLLVWKDAQNLVAQHRTKSMTDAQIVSYIAEEFTGTSMFSPLASTNPIDNVLRAYRHAAYAEVAHHLLKWVNNPLRKD